jgi:molybdate transport system ATP-binding protein
VSLALRIALHRPQFSLEIDCELPPRGITGVFGRTSSGKTTLLRCIAGLERQTRGRIAFDGEVWLDGTHSVPTHRRGVGYVFQEASLFAHLDVQGNLAFGLRRVPPAGRHLTLDEVTALLELRPLLRHRAAQLSGGERQRVAIGRALLASPRLLLLDEPLSSLDQRSKAEILPHLARLRDRTAVPMLYVTHALGEIMRLADHLLLLEAGRVQAAGRLQSLLSRSDLPLARSEESGSVFDAVLEEHDPRFHLSYVRLAAGRLAIGHTGTPPGERVRVRIDARDVSLALKPPEQSSILNVLPARVVTLVDADDPAQTVVQLEAGGEPLLARITRRSAADLQLSAGMPLYAQVKAVAVMESSASGFSW